MADLDTRFYCGTDEYSDGDEAENSILQIVREGKRFYDLDQMSWPTFYHLNPVRENICNWYPFERGSRVLEIGAGCGGVTGALCGRGLQVYSVDLSLRRSTINYERHRNAEDLHLVVGNLNDVSFPEPFDYILLIGVLEYAGRFTEGEHPYQRFLENIRRWLNPSGKLLIAIENRLGMKYFAGAGEDHLGIPFIGLKGYPEDRGIRTFSRGELEHLLKKSGYRDCRIYYPYPDYKLPEEIFTDGILHYRYYGTPYQVFDQDRSDIFPEHEMTRTLQGEGVAGTFANSFLAEAVTDADAMDPQQVYYAKLNKGRRKTFQTGIRIYGTGKPEQVSRYAIEEEAEEHIARIAENERRMEEERNILRGTREGLEIRYPFLTSRTLEDQLREAELDQDREAVIEIFRKIRELAEVKPIRESYDSEPFTEWFGKERTAKHEPVCTKVANVNLTPDNIFMDQGKLIISDCEWVTDFAVPVSFLTWRSVDRTYEKHSMLQKTLSKEDLWQALDIPEENIPVYQKWSRHFDDRYVSERSLSCFAKSHELTNFNPAMRKEKDTEILNQKAQIEQLKQQESVLTEEMAAQRRQISQLTRRREELEEDVRQQKEQALRLKRDLEDLLSSRSWRMTAVFRKVHQKISGKDKNKQS